MSAPNPARTARELIEYQLVALGELRNAHARDAGFKAWRQATLTAIQRVWPGDPTRAERFRRVPFSAPSSKMTAAVTRQFFEKGCAEAMQLLRGFVADAGDVRISEGDAGGNARALAPGEAEDDFPVLELPAGPTGAAAGAEGDGVPVLDLDASAPPARPPSLPAAETLAPAPTAGPEEADASVVEGRDETPDSEPDRVSDTQRELDAAFDAMQVRPRPVPRRNKNGREHREHPRAGKPPRRERPRPPVRNMLKDMLGFTDPPDAVAPPEPVAGPATPRKPAPEVSPPPVSPPPPAAEPRAQAPVASPAKPPRLEPEPAPAAAPPRLDPGRLSELAGDDDPFAPPDAEEREARAAAPAATPDATDDRDARMETFLRESPVLSATPRPLARTSAASETPRAATPSPAAATLAALAAELAHLGVPDGHHLAARAELLDLARRLDSGPALTWESLRGVMTFVMEYPPLARRVIPLLIPYLDLAA